MEQNHFSYEGSLKIKSGSGHSFTLSEPAFEIEQVVFLTPAMIKAKVNGRAQNVMVSVDIINRKVYDATGSDQLSEIVFSHLDEINTLPENFFSAPEELSVQASEADEHRERMFADAVNGLEQENQEEGITNE